MIVLCAGQAGVFGQVDTVHLLLPVEVTARRIDLSDIGKHSDQLDSQTLDLRQYNSLSNLLAIQTPLYVRSYGAGTLSTLGIRGGNASHTQVLWNGIPLRNPMVGLVDLALLPVTFSDHVAVHYGGHGAAFGSGAVGGLIALGNAPVSLQDEFNVHIGAGSWATYLGDASLTYGFKKLRFRTAIFYQEAENNYRYRLNEDQPERNQVHSAYKNEGVLQEIRYRLSDKDDITARFWYQYADRQIPPTSTQTNSKSAQQDESYRASLQWSRNMEKLQWQCKLAWLDEAIDYQDSLILLYTHNRFRTWLGEVSAVYKIKPALTISGGVYAENVKAESANYDTKEERHQQAVFLSASAVHGDWVWRYQMREEFTDGSASPLLVDLSAEWSGIRHIQLKANVARNYRLPTLNDLYWQPGGNPQLKPEEGWTAETGIGYETTAGYWDVHVQATVYGRKMDEWILWMPPVKDIRNYWSPINVAQVNSRGIEFRADAKWNVKDWVFRPNVGTDLTWSTFGQDLPEFMIQEGDQLFYIPVENVQAGLRLEKAWWSVHYYHHWFGESPGINDDVEAGNVGTAGANLNFSKGKTGWTLYLQADNVWNVPYRLIERRPMPGRSFMGGVKLTFS